MSHAMHPRSSWIALFVVACGGPAASDEGGTTTSSGEGGSAPSTSATPTSDVPTTTVGDDTHGTSTSSGEASTDASADGVDLGSDDTTGGSSPGCGNALAPTGEAVRSLTIQGVERTFIVDAPETIDPELPLALVFVFHGNGGNGQASQGMGLQNVPGARDEAVFLFPDGIDWGGFGLGWDGYCGEYDMELFDAMVATISDDYCIDPDRIFAAGFSWGGDMCQALACCRGDVVRAIAPASGPELFPTYPAACPDTERPAFRMTYATNDAYPPNMFADTIEWHRTEQGCAETSAPVDPEPCIAYDGCAKPVIACEYEGLGHAWPGDWADETWAFFSQHP